MKNTSFLLNTLFVTSCAWLIGSKSIAEPLNLYDLKTQLVAYQTSGDYSSELSTVAQAADDYITQTVTANKTSASPKKLALVLDIDETSLSNYQFMHDADFCFNQEKSNQALQKGNDPAIQPILSLYQHAVKEGVAVFFITGRPTRLMQATVNNLKAAGYNNWAGIYLRPDNDTNASVIPYKSQARQTITQSGYDIIASIGDQQSDLNGGFADKTFKLPNPYYYIP